VVDPELPSVIAESRRRLHAGSWHRPDWRIATPSGYRLSLGADARRTGAHRASTTFNCAQSKS